MVPALTRKRLVWFFSGNYRETRRPSHCRLASATSPGWLLLLLLLGAFTPQ